MCKEKFACSFGTGTIHDDPTLVLEGDQLEQVDNGSWWKVGFCRRTSNHDCMIETVVRSTGSKSHTQTGVVADWTGDICGRSNI
jgi:hypothetical protein